MLVLSLQTYLFCLDFAIFGQIVAYSRQFFVAFLHFVSLRNLFCYGEKCILPRNKMDFSMERNMAVWMEDNGLAWIGSRGHWGTLMPVLFRLCLPLLPLLQGFVGGRES